MKRVLLALLALAGAAPLRALHSQPPATMVRFNTDKDNAKIANKSLEFVNNIREHLRRNNDDYEAELERQKILISGTQRVPPTRVPPTRVPPTRVPPTRVPPTRVPPTRVTPVRVTPTRAPPTRIPLKREPPKQVPPKREPLRGLPPKVSLDTRRILNVTQNRTTIGVSKKPSMHVRLNVNLFRSNTQAQRQHYKKIRIDRLKRLIDKGKSRLRELTGTSETTLAGVEGIQGGAEALDAAEVEGAEGAEGAQGAEGATGGAGGGGAGDTEPSPAALPLPATTHRPKLAALPSDHKLGHQRNILRHREVMEKPSADQLDMSPARGPLIHVMRLSGRLCQRNMLLPEGPMYDKLGVTLAPDRRAELKYGWERLATTLRPRLLLPRCCNCCKKSVLGCE